MVVDITSKFWFTASLLWVWVCWRAPRLTVSYYPWVGKHWVIGAKPKHLNLRLFYAAVLKNPQGALIFLVFQTLQLPTMQNLEGWFCRSNIFSIRRYTTLSMGFCTPRSYYKIRKLINIGSSGHITSSASLHYQHTFKWLSVH